VGRRARPRRAELTMAHAYTPGLRVAPHASVLRVRRLPLRGNVLARIGQSLRAEDVVARTELPGNVHTVKVASLLGIPPDDIREAMLKKEGDAVAKDEVIAQTKSFFGVFSSRCAAPVAGTLEAVSAVTGQAILREAPIPVEVDAYVDGVVAEVLPGEGVVMRAEGAFVQGIFGIGGEACGEIRMVCGSPRDALTEERVAGDLAGRIIVGGSIVTRGALAKAVAARARAVIAGGVSAADLTAFLGYDIGVAITGHEEKGITLIITEGFGELAMAERTFALLRRCDGMRASVNGATQIRAGVMRPEIIVPDAPAAGDRERAGGDRALAGGDRARADADRARGDAEPGGGMRVGSAVRTIREPWFGRLGVVTALPHELREIETEARVRVLTVRLDDGAEITLPRANVEMVEE